MRRLLLACVCVSLAIGCAPSPQRRAAKPKTATTTTESPRAAPQPPQRSDRPPRRPAAVVKQRPPADAAPPAEVAPPRDVVTSAEAATPDPPPPAAPPPAPPRPAPPARAPAESAATETVAAEWRVVSVHDGDTVLCLDGRGRQRKVRLVGIDAPEIGQPFGTKSRDGLRAMVLRKTVAVRDHGKDHYGRTLGALEIGGDDVAERMVASGLAWHFKRYSDSETLAAAERTARAAHRGLWADADPMPPWEWRATERTRKTTQRAATSR